MKPTSSRHDAIARVLILVMSFCIHADVVSAQSQEDAVQKSIEAANRNAEQPFGHFDWQSWTTHDGLPQNSVTAIEQTRDGYLWLGTHAGLARFDGLNFTVFDVNNTPTLGGDRILSLMEDADGDLWIGTSLHGVVRMRNGEFTSFKGHANAPVGKIKTILQDQTGAIWFGGDNLTQYLDGDFTELVPYNGVIDPRQHWAIDVDSENHLWIATRNREIRFPYQLQQGKDAAEIWQKISKRKIGETPDGRKWARGKYWLIGSDANRLENADVTGALPHRVLASTTDQHGDYWLATIVGLLRYVPSTKPESDKEFRFENIFQANGIDLGQVQSLLTDRQGNLWAGTRRKGLVRIGRKQFESFQFPLAGHPRWAIPTSRSTIDRIWLAFNAHFLCLVDGKFSAIPIPKGIRRVQMIAVGTEGTLWVAHDGNRLSKFKDNQWKSYEHELGQITRMLCSQGGSIWICSAQGVSIFKDGQFETLETPDPIRQAGMAVILHETLDEVLWIGTPGKITRLKDGVFEQMTVSKELPSDEIRGFLQTKDGSLWISTYGRGLLRYKDGRFTRITKNEGIVDNSLGRILQDSNGMLWINSNCGVFCVKVEDLNAVADGQANTVGIHLLKTNEGNGAVGGYLPDGKLWFPTTEGIVTFDPNDSGKMNGVQPLVNIEAVSADYTELDHRFEINVQPGRGDLEFRFSSPDFVDPENTRFRYMLSGYDQDWVYAGTQRTARYTNIKPGEYSFRVMACNRSGVWSENVATQRIVIHPHFYQTIWIRIACLVLLVGLVVAGFQIRTRQIRKRNAALQLSEERMELALRGAGLATWDWNIQTGTVTFNQRFAEMLGLELNEIETTWGEHQEIIHSDDKPRVDEFLKSHIDGNEELYEIEYRLKHHSGEWVWILDKGRVTARDHQDLPLRMCGTYRDITERVQLKEQIEQHRNQLAHVARLSSMGEMATGLAHEINQPLAVMSNYCAAGLQSLEKDETPDPDFMRDLFENMTQMTMRTAEIIRRLRSLVGKRPSVRVPLDLLDPIREVLHLFESDLRHADVHVKLHLDHHEKAVQVDEIQIQQVLVNLFRNALESMCETDRERILEILTARRNEMIEVAVRDTGIGIHENTAERVFDAFYSNKPEGMGMGLAINRSIIESHGGQMWMLPNENHGLTFYFTLPIAGPQSGPELVPTDNVRVGR